VLLDKLIEGLTEEADVTTEVPPAGLFTDQLYDSCKGVLEHDGPVVLLVIETGKTVQPLSGEGLNAQTGGATTQIVCDIVSAPQPELDCTFWVIV
jgi:hypothetical protein